MARRLPELVTAVVCQCRTCTDHLIRFGNHSYIQFGRIEHTSIKTHRRSNQHNRHPCHQQRHYSTPRHHIPIQFQRQRHHPAENR